MKDHEVFESEIQEVISKGKNLYHSVLKIEDYLFTIKTYFDITEENLKQLIKESIV